MAAKLSDTELARRVRERSQQRSIRYRERLSRSGRVQTLIWLPNTLRRQLDALTKERDESLSLVTTELLSAALSQTTPPARPALAEPEPLPLFAESTGPSVDARPSDRDTRILELKGLGLSNPKIGLQVGCSEGSVRRALKRLNQEATG